MNWGSTKKALTILPFVGVVVLFTVLLFAGSDGRVSETVDRVNQFHPGLVPAAELAAKEKPWLPDGHLTDRSLSTALPQSAASPSQIPPFVGTQCGTAVWDIQNPTQIAVSEDGTKTHIAWHWLSYGWACINEILSEEVHYNVWDSELDDWVFGFDGCDISETWNCYPNSVNPKVDLSDDGSAVISLESYEGSYNDNLRLRKVQNPSICASDEQTLIWPSSGSYTGGPQMVVDRDSPCDVYHIATWVYSHESGLVNFTLMAYWRYDTCDSVWEGPSLLPDTVFISRRFLTSDEASDRVILAFLSRRGPLADSAYYDNDLVYYESLDNGMSWINGDWNLRHNVTDYKDSDDERFYVGPGGGFTSDGRLHLVWGAPYYDATNEITSGRFCNLRHWTEQTPGSNSPIGIGASCLVSQAHWYPGGSPGGGSRNFSTISVGLGDGSTLCEVGENSISSDDFLYVCYTQFGSYDSLDLADTSVSGYQNGNLYLSISGDGGQHWSPGRCVSSLDSVGGEPTRTPDCDPTIPGMECMSEHRASIAQLVNDTVHIAYVGDLDPGKGVPFDAETGFWENPYMYQRVAGGDFGPLCPLQSPNLCLDYVTGIDNEYEPPCTNPLATDTIFIQNTGYDSLKGSLTIEYASPPTPPHEWLKVAHVDSLPIALTGDDPQLAVPLTMPDSAFLPSGSYSARVLLTHNDPTKPSPIPLSIVYTAPDTTGCELECLCSMTPGEVTLDGVINVLDVIFVIDYVFRSGPSAPSDSFCSYPIDDLNCDTIVNVLDVISLIDYVFRSGGILASHCGCS